MNKYIFIINIIKISNSLIDFPFNITEVETIAALHRDTLISSENPPCRLVIEKQPSETIKYTRKMRTAFTTSTEELYKSQPKVTDDPGTSILISESTPRYVRIIEKN